MECCLNGMLASDQCVQLLSISQACGHVIMTCFTPRREGLGAKNHQPVLPSVLIIHANRQNNMDEWNTYLKVTFQNLENHTDHQYLKHSSNLSVDQRINMFLITPPLDLQTCDLQVSHSFDICSVLLCAESVRGGTQGPADRQQTRVGATREAKVHHRGTAAQERGSPLFSLYFLPVSLPLM